MKKYMFDSYWPADESYPSSETSLQSLMGFLKEPEAAIYCYDGSEITLEGKLKYSTIEYRKNWFKKWVPDHEIVSDDEYKSLCQNPLSRSIEITTEIEPPPSGTPYIRCDLSGNTIGASANRNRQMRIYVSKDYSSRVCNGYRDRFQSHIDLIEKISKHFEAECQKGFGRNYPFETFTISDYWIHYGSGSSNRLGIRFNELGMQPLQGDVSKIAFMDCMLDYLRDRFNSGSEFDSETIKLRFFEPKRADNEVYMVIQNTKQSTLKSW